MMRLVAKKHELDVFAQTFLVPLAESKGLWEQIRSQLQAEERCLLRHEQAAGDQPTSFPKISSALTAGRVGYQSVFDMPLTLTDILKKVVCTPKHPGGVSMMANLVSGDEFDHFRAFQHPRVVRLLTNYFQQQQVVRGLAALANLVEEAGVGSLAALANLVEEAGVLWDGLSSIGPVSESADQSRSYVSCPRRTHVTVCV